MRQKLSPSILGFIISAIGLSLCIVFFIPFFVLKPNTLQVDVSHNYIEVKYEGKSINKVLLKTPLKRGPLTIVINHDHYFVFRSFSPHATDYFLLTDTDTRKTQSLKSKYNSLQPFPMIYALLHPYTTTFLSEDRYPHSNYSTSITAKNLPKSFRLKISTTNLHDINLFLGNTNLWLRPQWHHENILKINQDTYLSAPADSKDYLNTFLQIVSVHLFGFFLFSTLLFLTTFLVKPFIKQLQMEQIVPHKKLILVCVTLCCVLFFFSSLWITRNINQKIPHSQDEVVYLFQSKIFASGALYAESLQKPYRRFFDHEFIINDGKWFGKYPPGTSIFLAFGQLIGAPYIINPLLGTLSLLCLYFFSTKLFSKQVGLLSVLLFGLSPFNLLISSSYLSHTSAMLMTLLTFSASVFKRPLIAGISLGLLLLIRPFNAILVGILLLISFTRLTNNYTFKGVLSNIFLVGIGILPSAIFSLVYSYQLTGNAFAPIFSMYSKTDTIGFGLRGVEWGAEFTIFHAIENTFFNLNSLQDILLGWPFFLTFVFLPWALFNKHRKALVFILLIIFIQIVGYFFYFGRGTFYGPRYWFEISPYIIIAISVGFFALNDRLKKLNASIISYLFLIILIIYSIARTTYLLQNIKEFNGMIVINPPPHILAPAVVFVSGDKAWYEYGRYFIHQSPSLTEEIIYARDKGFYPIHADLKPLKNKILKDIFPDRHIYLLKDQKLTPVE